MFSQQARIDASMESKNTDATLDPSIPEAPPLAADAKFHSDVWIPYFYRNVCGPADAPLKTVDIRLVSPSGVKEICEQTGMEPRFAMFLATVDPKAFLYACRTKIIEKHLNELKESNPNQRIRARFFMNAAKANSAPISESKKKAGEEKKEGPRHRSA